MRYETLIIGNYMINNGKIIFIDMLRDSALYFSVSAKTTSSNQAPFGALFCFQERR